MEKTVKRVIMPILVLVMIAAAFMGAFAFTNTASAETSVAITASNTTVVGGATISSFKPEGEGIPTDGYGLYKEAGLGLKFDFPEKLDVSSFTGNDINKYVFEYWFWADGIPTNGFRIQYNGDSAFSMVDPGNLAGQSDIFNDYTPKTWQKVIITARGCFGGGAYEGKIHGINFEGGNFGSLNAYIYNPVIRLKTDSDSVVGFVGFVETKQVAPSEVTISEGTVAEGVRTLNKYFVEGAPDFTLTAATDNLATNNAVTWSSANDEIATVTADGTVHLVSAGEVVLTASAVAAPAVKSEIKLVVTTPTNPVTAVTINDDASVPAEMGGSKQYTADLTTASGEDPDDTTVVWTVTNGTGSATVANDGTVTFVSAGTVTLRATSFNGVYDEKEITITEPAAVYMNMDLSAAHGSISTGSLSDVIPALEGEGLPITSINPGNFMSQANWSWFDSSVDCTALLGTKKALFEFYVYFESDYNGAWQPSIFGGTSEQLKGNANGDMAFFQSDNNQSYKAGWNKVTIAIDNTKVTSNYLAFGAVDHTGGMPQIYFYGARVYYSASVYDALGAGKMRIEAMNITAPTGVSISGLSNVEVAAGEVTLTAAVTPSHASQEVTWSIVSGNASVDQTGKVTFTEAGSVEVKAECKANPAISATHRIYVAGAYDAVTSVEINDKASVATDVTFGTSVTLTATVLPATADLSVIWSVTEGTATVTNGTVKFTGTGTVTVKVAAAADETKFDTITFNVTTAAPVTKTFTTGGYVMFEKLDTSKDAVLPAVEGMVPGTSGVLVPKNAGQYGNHAMANQADAIEIAPYAASGKAVLKLLVYFAKPSSDTCVGLVPVSALINGSGDFQAGCWTSMVGYRGGEFVNKTASWKYVYLNLSDTGFTDTNEGRAPLATDATGLYVPAILTHANNFTALALYSYEVFVDTDNFMNGAKIKIVDGPDSYFEGIQIDVDANHSTVKGTSFDIAAKIGDIGTDDTDVEWTSSNDIIASVLNGKVYINGTGEVKITCKSASTDYKAEYTFTATANSTEKDLMAEGTYNTNGIKTDGFTIDGTGFSYKFTDQSYASFGFPTPVEWCVSEGWNIKNVIEFWYYSDTPGFIGGVQMFGADTGDAAKDGLLQIDEGKIDGGDDVAANQKKIVNQYGGGYWVRLAVTLRGPFITGDKISDALGLFRLSRDGGAKLPECYIYGLTMRAANEGEVKDTAGTGGYFAGYQNADNSDIVARIVMKSANISSVTRVLPTAIAISGSDKGVVGGTSQLSAKITPDDATERGVEWRIVSGNATITQTGLVTFTGTGEVVVEVKSTADENIKSTITITVTEPVTEIYLEDYDFSGSEVDDFRPEGFTEGTVFYHNFSDGTDIRWDFGGLDVNDLFKDGRTDTETVNNLIFEYWVYSTVVPTYGYEFCFDTPTTSRHVIDPNNNQQGSDMTGYTPYTWQKVRVAMRGKGGAFANGSGSDNYDGVLDWLRLNSSINEGEIYIFNPRFVATTTGELGGNGFQSTGKYIELKDVINVKATSVSISGTGVEGENGQFTLTKLTTAADFTLSATADKLATNKAVTWTANNPDIATITGDVISIVKAGTATFTVASVSDPTVTATLTLTVKAPDKVVTDITVSDKKTGDPVTELGGYIGGKIQLYATITPADADDTGVTWTIMEGNATVSADGLVSFGKTTGTVVVRAYSSDSTIYYDVEINVTVPEEVFVTVAPGTDELGGEMASSNLPAVDTINANSQYLVWRKSGQQGRGPSDLGVDVTDVVNSGYGVIEYVIYLNKKAGGFTIGIATASSNDPARWQMDGVAYDIGATNFTGENAGWYKISFKIDGASHKGSVDYSDVKMIMVDHPPIMKDDPASDCFIYSVRVYSDYEWAVMGSNNLKQERVESLTGKAGYFAVKAEGVKVQSAGTYSPDYVANVPWTGTAGSATFTFAVNASAENKNFTVTMTEGSSIATFNAETGVLNYTGEGRIVLTAVAEDGTATSEVVINVATVYAESVKVTADKTTQKVGATGKITAVISPSDAFDKTLTTTVKLNGTVDAAAATLTANTDGTYTVVYNKAGEITIEVSAVGKDGAVTGSVKVNVLAAPNNVTLDQTELTGEAGNTATLVVTVDPEIFADEATWSSSDDSVASVDENGVVTFHKAGTATITVTVEGKTATCSVTVTGNTNGGDGNGLSTGAIIGIVAACVVVVGGGAAAFFILKKKKA